MKSTEIAVYYFPNYHVDKKNELRHGNGWSEWELVKTATPRFEGHIQPKIPLWGYEDESKPEVMAKKIAAASDNNVNCFIFDWYWYADGPFLQNCIENGFLEAENTNKLKFSLMWANHDWNDIFPATSSDKWHNFTKGNINESEFENMTDYIIEKYFIKPNYWKVNGGLYFSIYDLASLIKGLNGIEKTKSALEKFRKKVRDAGLGELHLNAIITEYLALPWEKNIQNQSDVTQFLGFDSVTAYVWIHHCSMDDFPFTDYTETRNKFKKINKELIKKNKIPFFPNVSMGWDSSPRTAQSKNYENKGYPYLPVFKGNTPEEFKLALIDAMQINEEMKVMPNIITVNSWNEWTEGSYLEPDTVNGMAYLDAIKRATTDR